MSVIRNPLMGYVGYRGREGQIAFILHRITGLGTLLFLGIHILDTSTVYFFPNLYNHAIALYRSTIFGIGELGLVFCVFYHGVNGLRIAFYDLLAPKSWQIPTTRASVIWCLAISLFLWLPAAVIMVRNILVHNFGLFGG